MHSLDAGVLRRQAIPLETAGMLRALGEARGRQELYRRQVPQALEALRQTAMIQSTESSNRIEGVEVRAGRLKPLVERRTAPRDRPEGEVAGYRDVLSRIHADPAGFEITPESIRTMHRDLFRHTSLPAGHWKRRDNVITENRPDGRSYIRFRPVSARETPRFMQAVCDRFARLHDEGRMDRLLLTHAFVFDLTCIHPFADGNGRIARLLTVLLLHREGYDVGRYISLERLIEESKETYYEALAHASEGWHRGRHTLLPWWRYSLGVLLAAHTEFETRAGDVRAVKGAKTLWIRQAVHRLPASFGIADAARLCPGVSRPMVRVVLEAMRSEGYLKVVGRGRNALWRKQPSK